MVVVAVVLVLVRVLVMVVVMVMVVFVVVAVFVALVVAAAVVVVRPAPGWVEGRDQGARTDSCLRHGNPSECSRKNTPTQVDSKAREGLTRIVC